jgi:hypothetical protein
MAVRTQFESFLLQIEQIQNKYFSLPEQEKFTVKSGRIF